jgi:hypothetical protein
MATLSELHTEMGRFLTESSQVENMMYLLFSVAQKEHPPRDAFVYFNGKTFGGKIDAFKEACDAYPFSEKHRVLLTQAYAELDRLLPKRNFIVHGTTYQMGIGEKLPQPYRIGMTKGDKNFMNNAIANNLEGPHVFTTSGISDVTDEFISLRGILATVALETIEPLAKPTARA